MIPDSTLRTLLDALRPAGPPLVFAYGSLIWEDTLPLARRRPARLLGFRRAYAQWDETSRGTPAAPGLTLGLLPGGACGGAAFALDRWEDAWPAWRQEMAPGHYTAAFVTLADGARALTFLSDPLGRLFAGERPAETVAPILARAEGRQGTARDYLFRTAAALRELGEADAALDRLAARMGATGIAVGAATSAAPARSPA